MKSPHGKGIVDRGTQHLIIISTALLLLIFVLIFIEVVGRNALSQGVRGATELAQIGMLLMVTAALPYVEYRADDLGMYVLAEESSPRTRRIDQGVVSLLQVG